MSVQAVPSEAFSVAVVPDRGEVAVVPSGEMDLASVDGLDREVRDLRRAGFDQVTIDLRDVTFIDSTGLRVLLSLRNDAARDGHHLALVPAVPSVQRIFDLTGTRGLFDWREPR